MNYIHCLLKDSICFEDSANSLFTSQINSSNPSAWYAGERRETRNQHPNLFHDQEESRSNRIVPRPFREVIHYISYHVNWILFLTWYWSKYHGFRYVCYTSIWTDVNIMSHNENHSLIFKKQIHLQGKSCHWIDRSIGSSDHCYAKPDLLGGLCMELNESHDQIFADLETGNGWKRSWHVKGQGS